MEKLMDLCMKYGLQLRLDFSIDDQGFFNFQIIKNADTASMCLSGKLSLSDYKESGALNSFIDGYYSAVITAFELNSINNILERAKVIWSDDPVSNKRTVSSHNPLFPLDDAEKTRIEQMWKSQGIKYYVEFL